MGNVSVVGQTVAEVARKLTDELLEGIGSSERRYSSKHTEIFLADVEADVDRFNLQISYCLDHELPFPCLVDPNGPDVQPIPLDVTFIPELFSSTLELSGFRSGLEYARINSFLFQEWGLKCSQFHVRDAESFFRNRLSDFLTARFSARQSDFSISPGIRFRVNTPGKRGLRVHYSPSYQLNPSHVFGAPTTPVDNWIRPGVWKFGVAGQNLKLRFDPADFSIPPLTEATLVI